MNNIIVSARILMWMLKTGLNLNYVCFALIGAYILVWKSLWEKIIQYI